MKDRFFHWFRMANDREHWHLVETGGVKSECGNVHYFGPVYSTETYPKDQNEVCKDCIGHSTLAELAE